MRRREVLTGFWLAVALPPVQAQPSGQMYRIAVIHPSHPTTVLNETGGLRYFKGLFGELRRLGYVEGQNMTVGRYSGQGDRPPIGWSGFNVSSRSVFAPRVAWPAELVGVAQPARRRRLARTPRGPAAGSPARHAAGRCCSDVASSR